MLHEWQKHFAEALRAPAMASIPADNTFLGTQVHRFSVYRDNMIGSLVEALGQTFPVTRQLVGGQFFDAVAADFVREDPPRAPRLSRYGGSFPERLRAMRQLRDLAYVADVAILEWARIESYFAGSSTETLLVETLLSQPTESLSDLIFRTVPSLRVVSTQTAAHSIWVAHQTAEPDLSSVDPWHGEAVRLLCKSAGLVVDVITAAHAHFLQALQSGQNLTTAALAASDIDPAFDLQSTLMAELSAGSFSSIIP